MSLKAKLEAVIYAAEEPVTLPQLAQLFAADTLEWKAAQETAAAEAAGQASEPEVLTFLEIGLENIGVHDYPKPELDEPPATEAELPADSEASHKAASEVASLVEEGLENIGIHDYPKPEPDGQPAAEAAALVDSVPSTEPLAEPAETVPGVDEAHPPAAPLDLEEEARRAARQRDREVRAILKQLLDELIADYSSDTRGIEIREIAGGYRMATKPACHDAVRLFVKSLKPPLKLSLPALETLAVVAYKQPVTAPEVSEIRGVETAGVLASLLARKLIATAGRKPVIGRPILYKTTREFLLRFGLKDLSELPSMEEFEKMAAAEIEEMEPEAVAADAAETAAETASEAADLETASSDDVELPEFSAAAAEIESDAAGASPTAHSEATTGATPDATPSPSNPQDAPPDQQTDAPPAEPAETEVTADAEKVEEER
jgi:segregation and condensation protein B